MRMTSLISSLIFTFKYIVIAVLLLLSPSYYSLSPKHGTLDSTQDVLVEEKTRLGSMPPSCYNKCNQCHPCMAVQVPTLPSHNRVEPGRGHDLVRTQYYNTAESSLSPSGTNSRISGYVHRRLSQNTTMGLGKEDREIVSSFLDF
ncbi:EPIDERMAL PATTERNING FACTOR-like protein 3 isoform X2 [Nicotiana sylvestris]|uniref:Epidermal patterning factor-like protein n=1 Tax=Nicotiana sylvestris TaxID=4096 RepID=A0A1U7WAU8_NICSY|nr:PREDICTED: EPIDERMAL PATTERNING FACTOR-like protein 3 isoform X2 [Nicotiana sylvestris]XP_009774357.1 PREDICTED: EPIDERMAL PATTERNING FACTOR-like protein 3 isoform X2 [Nicotiana sylvestris]